MAEGVLPMGDVDAEGGFDFGFVQDGVERAGCFDRVLSCFAWCYFAVTAADLAGFICEVKP